jgi:hypothetical protein
VLLFQKRFHQGLVDGSIRTTFRQWDKPRVKPGGRYRVHPIGVVVVDSVGKVRVGALRDEDARSAGFRDREALLEYLRGAAKGPLGASTELFRIELHHGGVEDFVDSALQQELSDEDVEVLVDKLRRLDGDAPWTRRTLTLIQKNPQVAASKLAPSFGLETLPFKERVRKLKRLGLTQSYEVGYDLSPRGRAFLARRKRW